MGTTKIIAEPGMPQLEITREFDAPPELLFRAYTDPSLLVQWLGPRKYAMTIDRYEPRDGGTWRYLHSDGEGNEHWFHGVFHGAPSLAGIVQTFEYEGAPGHVSLETVSFEGRNGKTLLRQHAVYQSVADRDQMVESGMEEGLNDSLNRLDELIDRLKSGR